MLSYIVAGVFALFEFLLVTGIFVEPLGRLLGDDPNAQFQNFVRFQFSLIVFYLVVRVILERAEVKKEILPILGGLDEVKKSLTKGVAEPLYQEEFYGRFEAEIAKAQRTVDITHLDVQLPGVQANRNSQTEKYFKNFSKIIKQHPNIAFRRVERCSPAKLEWVEQLASQLQGKSNFSLAFLDTTSSEPKLPEVSVQIIDSKRVFVVAVGRHSDNHGYRDLVIVDENIARLWLSYYDEVLWNRSIVIIQSGRLDEAMLKGYRERAELMRGQQ